MNKGTVKKTIVLGIIILFVGTSVFPLMENVRADGPGYVIAQGQLGQGCERKLARTSDGFLHSVYCRLDGSYNRIYYAHSINDGVTWTEEPESISPPLQNCGNPCIAVGQNDNIHVAWTWARAPVGSSWYSTIQYRVKTTTGWQGTEDVITGYYECPSLAIDSGGVVHLAIGGYGGGAYHGVGVQYLKKVTPSSSWSSPFRVSSSVWANLPELVVDGNNDIHILYIHAPRSGPYYGLRYRRTIGGAWQGEEIIQTDDAAWSYGSLAVDSTGDVYAVWCNANTGQIKLGKRSPSGTWPQPFGDVLAADGYSKQNAVISIDGSNTIHIVWCGKDANSPNYFQMRYRKYSNGWSGVSYLTSASVNQQNPGLIWAWYPMINGVHTNIPQNGYAFVWNDGSTSRFYKSSDLTWDSQGQNQEDIYWLAKVIKNEAGGIDVTDSEKIAVGWTVLNRLEYGGRFGKTIKEVAQNGYVPYWSQPNKEPTNSEIQLAISLLNGQLYDYSEDATHFFSPRSQVFGFGPYPIPNTSPLKESLYPYWSEPKNGWNTITQTTTRYITIKNEFEWRELSNIRNWYFMFYRPYSKRMKTTLGSPGELRVYDSQGNVTGLVNGIIKNEIPGSNYSDSSVTIYFPIDFYQNQVVGLESGLYGLNISLLTIEQNIYFSAINISTIFGAVHNYLINWSALSQGQEGVTIQIDNNNDGIFERTITSDGVLTKDEFNLLTATIIDFDPNTLNRNSNGKWVTTYIELPDGFNVSNITISSIKLNGVVPAQSQPTNIGDYDNDGIPDLMVKFSRSAVAQILQPGNNVEIKISGTLINGMEFEGVDYIRVI